MNALGYILGLYALYWFKKLKLDIKYQKEIEAWLLQTKQEKFSKKLEKQMLEEIDKYMGGKISIEDLMKERFPEPKWIIEDNR
uniref:Uncharacterized protein n=1 Tax=viral metagenome TaxID=1070528 RepID=A0A6M3KCC7_9ZZZZ